MKIGAASKCSDQKWKDNCLGETQPAAIERWGCFGALPGKLNITDHWYLPFLWYSMYDSYDMIYTVYLVDYTGYRFTYIGHFWNINNVTSFCWCVWNDQIKVIELIRTCLFVISKYIVSVHVGVAQYDVKTHVWYHKNLYGKIFLFYFRWAMLAKILWNSWWSMKKTIRWSKAYRKKKIRSVTKRIASFCESNNNFKDY